MKTKEILSISFTGVLVFCALVITGLVIRQEFFPPEPEPEIRQIEDWRQLQLNGQKTGSDNAAVQIVEFFDYQCPFCKSVQPVVQKVKQKYSDQLSVRYEHLPLNGHDHAFKAAVAAECAAKQGKFQSFHDLLFFNQNSLGYLSYDSLATEAGIERITSFTRCLENKKTANIVESGLELAEQLGIDGVPTFIINGKLVSGALSEKRLEFLVKEALEKQAN